MAQGMRAASIKRMDGDKLHVIARTLRCQEWDGEAWSEGQTWLWELIVAELERRHRRAPSLDRQCHCDLCVPPFP